MVPLQRVQPCFKLNIQQIQDNSRLIVFYFVNPFREKKSMEIGLQQLFSPPSKLLHFPTEVTLKVEIF